MNKCTKYDDSNLIKTERAGLLPQGNQIGTVSHASHIIASEKNHNDSNHK